MSAKKDMPREKALKLANDFLEKTRDLYSKIEIAGSIPFDPTVTQAMVQGEPVTA